MESLGKLKKKKYSLLIIVWRIHSKNVSTWPILLIVRHDKHIEIMMEDRARKGRAFVISCGGKGSSRVPPPPSSTFNFQARLIMIYGNIDATSWSVREIPPAGYSNAMNIARRDKRRTNSDGTRWEKGRERKRERTGAGRMGGRETAQGAEWRGGARV